MIPSYGDRKRLLLTGASGKLGTKFIELFADRFAIIALTNTRPTAASTQTSTTFDALNESRKTAEVTEIKCDLADSAQTRACINAIVDLTGPVTYLVNAAADVRFLGATLDAVHFEQQAAQQWRVNVLAPMVIASVFFQRCWKNVPVAGQEAAILNVSSVSGRTVFPGTRQASYAASKAALDMVTLYMAAEYKAYGIRVNGLAPGAFPSQVATQKVAEAALKILQGDETGKIYVLGGGPP